MMEDSNPSLPEHPENESVDDTKFSKSLQELKALCTQLHHAADYCESAFLNSDQKQLVVDNTKEYVCRAVVTVVDHLGSVSANLDYQLSKTDSISQTEVRIDFLKQKLLTCQEYSHKLALARVSWRADTPRYNYRYIKPPISDIMQRGRSLRESGGQIVVNTVNNKDEFKIDEEVPLFLYTCKPQYLHENALPKTGDEKIDSSSLPVLPVRDGLSVQPKPQSSSFQLQDKRKSRRSMLLRKSMTNNEILSLILRRK